MASRIARTSRPASSTHCQDRLGVGVATRDGIAWVPLAARASLAASPRQASPLGRLVPVHRGQLGPRDLGQRRPTRPAAAGPEGSGARAVLWNRHIEAAARVGTVAAQHVAESADLGGIGARITGRPFAWRAIRHGAMRRAGHAAGRRACHRPRPQRAGRAPRAPGRTTPAAAARIGDHRHAMHPAAAPLPLPGTRGAATSRDDLRPARRVVRPFMQARGSHG